MSLCESNNFTLEPRVNVSRYKEHLPSVGFATDRSETVVLMLHCFHLCVVSFSNVI